MSEGAIVQIFVSLLGVIGSIVAVLAILARKLGNLPSGNHQKQVDNGLQTQINSGALGTKTLAERFDEQVRDCGDRWIAQAKVEGKIEAYMIEIRDRLGRLEGR